jgi:hypothetical protein
VLLWSSAELYFIRHKKKGFHPGFHIAVSLVVFLGRFAVLLLAIDFIRHVWSLGRGFKSIDGYGSWIHDLYGFVRTPELSFKV